MKRLVTHSVTAASRRSKNDNLKITSDAVKGLDRFRYWIKEAKIKDVPVNEIADYIYSRTFDNKRSSYYGDYEAYKSEFDGLCDLISQCQDATQLNGLSTKLQRDGDVARRRMVNVGGDDPETELREFVDNIIANELPEFAGAYWTYIMTESYKGVPVAKLQLISDEGTILFTKKVNGWDNIRGTFLNLSNPDTQDRIVNEIVEEYNQTV